MKLFTYLKTKATTFKNFVLTKLAAIRSFFSAKIAAFKTSIREDFTSNKKLDISQKERKYGRAVSRMVIGSMLVMMLMPLMGITAFAADDGVETFNTVVEFIVDWVARIGLVIAFVGAVQFAMGFKDDNADGKTRGLMCLASGFIVFAVCKAYDMFQE